MKRFLKALFFTFIFQDIFGQVQVRSLSLIDENEKRLYIGVSNKLLIKGLTRKSKLKFKKSKYEKVSESVQGIEFLVYPVGFGMDTLEIEENDNVIFRSVYLLEYIGTPFCKFNKQVNDLILKRDLLNEPILKCEIPNCYLKFNFQVLSFRLSRVNDTDTVGLYENSESDIIDTVKIINKEIKEVSEVIRLKKGVKNANPDSNLTQFQLAVIEKMSSGSRLFFSEVYVMFPDGIKRRMNDFSVKLIHK